MVRIPLLVSVAALGLTAVGPTALTGVGVSANTAGLMSGTTPAVRGQTPASAPTVTLDMVPVGDAGNPADPATGYGGVAEAFTIAKYEVTIAQYVAFLNAVAAVPANDVITELFKEEMADPEEDPGVLIERTGAGTQADPYRYAAATSAFWSGEAAAQRPVAWVTWFDAARFANWLHNGATSTADTETGAYTLTDYQQAGYVARNDDARFWIPSENEWYKAAYYDPTEQSAQAGPGKYWNYPTMSDKPPRFAQVSQAAAPPAANFQNVYKGSDAGVLAPAGSYPESASHYGTLDQGGQLWEWTEAAYPYPDRGPNRIVRGGSWGPGITPLSKTVRRDYGPMASEAFYFDDDTGFRLAGSSQP